jgi:hypothetical protein
MRKVESASSARVIEGASLLLYYVYETTAQFWRSFVPVGAADGYAVDPGSALCL